MEMAIGALFFFIFLIILYKPEKWISEKADKIEGRPTFWQLIIFFLIGLYGGFIQAGVGFMLLAGLVLGAGVNLTKANALKMFIMLVFTGAALIVFILNRQISYLPGFVLASGNILGALIASRVAIKSGPRIVRIILLVILMLSSLKFTGAIDFLIRLFS
jgi:uncharacterized membrane protein YfcA